MPRVPKAEPKWAEKFCEFAAKAERKRKNYYAEFAELFAQHWEAFAEAENGAMPPPKKRARDPQKALESAIKKVNAELSVMPESKREHAAEGCAAALGALPSEIQERMFGGALPAPAEPDSGGEEQEPAPSAKRRRAVAAEPAAAQLAPAAGAALRSKVDTLYESFHEHAAKTQVPAPVVQAFDELHSIATNLVAPAPAGQEIAAQAAAPSSEPASPPAEPDRKAEVMQ